MDGDGLVAILHSWESGLDASPLYDLPYNVKHPKPTLLEMYPKFIELCVDYTTRYRWNQTEILHRTKAPFDLIDGWFVVKDVGVSAVYATGWGVLAEVAEMVGNQQLATECRAAHVTSRSPSVHHSWGDRGAEALPQVRAESAIIDKCWDPQLQRFISYYRARDGSEAKISVEAVQSLFPLMLETLPKNMQGGWSCRSLLFLHILSLSNLLLIRFLFVAL